MFEKNIFMSNQPVTATSVYQASVARVWSALVNNSELQKWYFTLPEFEAEVGFTFTFVGGPDEEHQYVHRCRITEVIPHKLISYTWAFDGYEGNSLVSFALSPGTDDATVVTVTHEGIETFAPGNPHFAKENFEVGWSHILNQSLKGYLEGVVG
jgi:uncharacterized protein YndB with AHSA1/START domain